MGGSSSSAQESVSLPSDVARLAGAPPAQTASAPSNLERSPQRRIHWCFLFAQILAVSLVTISGFLFWCTTPLCRVCSTVIALSGVALFFLLGHAQEWEQIERIRFRDLLFRRAGGFLSGDVSLLNYVFGRSLPQYIGRLSYSLYLWHFPVNVLCAQYRSELKAGLLGESNLTAGWFQIAIMLVLSCVSYHLIENPYRLWRADKMDLPSWSPVAIVLVIVGILEFVVWHFRTIAVARVKQAFFERAAHVHTEKQKPLLEVRLLVFLLGVGCCAVGALTLWRWLSASEEEEQGTSPVRPRTPVSKRLLKRWWRQSSFVFFILIFCYWKWNISSGLRLVNGLVREESKLSFGSSSLGKTGAAALYHSRDGFPKWSDEKFGSQLKVAEVVSGFSCRACACHGVEFYQASESAFEEPPASSEEYPLCFQPEFWKRQARLYTGRSNPAVIGKEWQSCHSSSSSVLPSADEITCFP